MSLTRAHIAIWRVVGVLLVFVWGGAAHTGQAETASQDQKVTQPFPDGTYDLSILEASDTSYVWSPTDLAVLIGKASYTGSTIIAHATVQLGNDKQDGVLSQRSKVFLPGSDASFVVNNSSPVDLNQDITGMGSLVFNGNGRTDVTGRIILMNPNPNENASQAGSTSGGKGVFPIGVDSKPLSGDIVIRSGDVFINGSGENTGDIDFNPTTESSLAGNIVDKNTQKLLGTVDSSGNITVAGDNQQEKDINAARLQGFVVNNDYVIVGQSSRGNLTVANGAVFAADTSTINVGLAASARGSTLTVDNAWLHAGILSVGNGDSTYDPSSYDNSQIPSQNNGTLIVKNGGVVNAIVSVAGNYLGSVGSVNVSGNSDTVNYTPSSQSTLAATNFFVNGSGIGAVDVGDGEHSNSGLIAVKNSIAFGVPSQDDLIGANKNSQVVQEQLQKKKGVLNIQTGGTVSVSDPRDDKGNFYADAIYAADNEKEYQFNLNGGTLQRGIYNDTSAGLSPLTTSLNITLNKTSFFDTNGGNILLAGALSGEGGFIKQNDGVLTLAHKCVD